MAVKKGAAGFEEGLAQLEDILQKMGDENTSLEDSIALYAKAAELIKENNDILARAEVKIKELDKAFIVAEDDE